MPSQKQYFRVLRSCESLQGNRCKADLKEAVKRMDSHQSPTNNLLYL
jgi:hypothetical protein